MPRLAIFVFVFFFSFRYPSIDVAFEVVEKDDIAVGDIVEVQVQLSLEDEDEGEVVEVFPRFPTARAFHPPPAPRRSCSHPQHAPRSRKCTSSYCY